MQVRNPVLNTRNLPRVINDVTFGLKPSSPNTILTTAAESDDLFI